MATTLRVRKGVLTRHLNTLSQLLSPHAKLGDYVGLQDQEERIDVKERTAQIRVAEVELKTNQTAFEKALFAFTEAVNSLENSLSEEEEGKVTEYVTNAKEIISRTEDLLVKLEVNKQRLSSQERPFSGNIASLQQERTTPLSGTELPRLPIPEFTGKIWQWDSFWELYNASVHSLQISDLQKFSYLLQALKGEARESISRFQVTSANYSLAVSYLKEKYSNVQNIITRLHSQLEQWNARSAQLKDQWKLYDQLLAITTQLESKGENLESPWLLSKILSKFSEAIQRRTLREKVSMPQHESWTLEKLMTTLDTVVKQEDEIERSMPRKKEPPNLLTSRGPELHAKRRSPFCLYCDSKSHWSTECLKITNPRARLEHLKKTNRCIGCGSKMHTFAECKSKGCLKCGKKHHTSTCFKHDAASTGSPQGPTKREERKKPSQTRQNFTMSAEDEVIPLQDQEVPDLTVMRVQGASLQRSHEDIFLLTGTLRTLHPRTKEPITLHVLLDTDRSFIDAKVAERLELPNNGTVSMKLRTLGARTAKETQCIDTCLNVWDAGGTKHVLHVCIHDNLTNNFNGGKLDEKDLLFIRTKRIKLSASHEGKMCPPEILIGCDQLWDFIIFDAPHFTLPSGLIPVPTQLGYMVSGKRLAEMERSKNKIQSSVHTVESYDDIDPWERHWAIQISEPEKEYSGPDKEEKALINALVLEYFNNSIEKRENGYVVRLPFKNDHEHLPDNRALALHRLRNVLRKCSTEPELLQQYNEVFQDQLKKNILEAVDENEESNSRKRHYLPHQSVITPDKDTTKFRVVFDASAHYKNCPSLNDVVHQGPIMLPKLYGILLRFRMGKHVLLSDVEKAFLQVHLHEDDREFTRCLWLKDISKPLSEDNLAVYRFTRVTFGINASPFLLSATILYHINNYVENKELAQEIVSNLYVDNLFVTAKSVTEGEQNYRELKTIFNDLNMNLRAFISDNSKITESVAPADRSINKSPKVLGIRWNSATDNFSLHVTMTSEAFISKRTIAQQIASVCDPCGWLIPLLVKAKRFQQLLWKEKYDWDEPLSESLQQEWNHITDNMSNFHKNIPRQAYQGANAHALVDYLLRCKWNSHDSMHISY